MREDDEAQGFNPIKFGLIGAAIVAAAVALLLWVHSYSKTAEALQQEISVKEQDLQKAKKENVALQEKFDGLTKESTETSAQLKKQLVQRDSNLVSIKREKDSESRTVAQLQQDKQAAETQIAQMKKDAEAKTQEIKRLQEQMVKVQSDLQRARAEAQRNAKTSAELQNKLNRITEGDQAAADAMVQQLAEARKQLKQEREVRRRLEEELDSLRQQNPTQ